MPEWRVPLPPPNLPKASAIPSRISELGSSSICSRTGTTSVAFVLFCARTRAAVIRTASVWILREPISAATTDISPAETCTPQYKPDSSQSLLRVCIVDALKRQSWTVTDRSCDHHDQTGNRHRTSNTGHRRSLTIFDELQRLHAIGGSGRRDAAMPKQLSCSSPHVRPSVGQLLGSSRWRYRNWWSRRLGECTGRKRPRRRCALPRCILEKCPRIVGNSGGSAPNLAAGTPRGCAICRFTPAAETPGASQKWRD